MSKSGLKLLICNVIIVYGNLKCENYQDCAQKPEQNCSIMNAASGELDETISWVAVIRNPVFGVQDALGGQEVPGGGEHAEEPGGGQGQIPQGA